MKKCVILCCLFLYNSFVEAHGIHISMGQIQVENQQVNGKIVVSKLDFVLDLAGWYKEGNLLDLPADKRMDVMYAYLKSHVVLRANGLPIFIEVLESGHDKDTIWFRFAGQSDAPIVGLVIENRLFLDMFDDQQNIMMISMPNKTYNLVFTRANPSHHLSAPPQQ